MTNAWHCCGDCPSRSSNRSGAASCQVTELLPHTADRQHGQERLDPGVRLNARYFSKIHLLDMLNRKIQLTCQVVDDGSMGPNHPAFRNCRRLLPPRPCNNSIVQTVRT